MNTLHDPLFDVTYKCGTVHMYAAGVATKYKILSFCKDDFVLVEYTFSPNHFNKFNL